MLSLIAQYIQQILVAGSSQDLEQGLPVPSEDTMNANNVSHRQNRLVRYRCRLVLLRLGPAMIEMSLNIKTRGLARVIDWISSLM